nr:uncharacterized protein LOC563036 [Danio rerio]|eukprot:XP_001919291.4 uncharacterized protein LOC563036 [Danio rerio]
MMSGGVASGICALLCVFLLCGDLPSAQGEKHSLYYIYTSLSKPLDLPGIYEFSAMGLLDDRQIDSYNSEEQRKIPKQQWMKEKMQEDYWEKGTWSRKSKEQWFNVNVHILMERMRHNMSDLHILQWRHGCEVEIQGSEVKFSKGVSEYGYDGENLLYFDDAESRWVAPVEEALPTKRKWDNIPILNQYTKGYLEKECVDWLNKFREYADEELRKASPPDVYKLTKKSTKDETKLKLTCLATGFYPNDVMLNIRRNCLPEDETESTGVRPNHDQTFQLRKSVEIKEDQIDEYDCHLTHRTLKNPVTATRAKQRGLMLKFATKEDEVASSSTATQAPSSCTDTDTGFSTGDRPSTSHAEKHSLYYIYTGLSKPLDLPGIYEFSAMGLLDDRQIDSYNSRDQRKIPKQQWMKEKMQEDYWEKGTQSRKSKEQWFNVNVNILMDRMRYNKSDLHILQWRHGCEVEIQGSEVKFSKGIDEYGYDGENFLAFDEAESQWVAPVEEALPTKRKWNNIPILNQYTKGYLEKECVDWLNKFREYADEELRKASSPDVYKLTKKSTKDETKLKLTCLATGFYDKDVMLNIRRNCLPEDETESTGVRPNHDQTFQLRKSVEIKEDQIDEYDCHLTHRTLKNPVTATRAKQRGLMLKFAAKEDEVASSSTATQAPSSCTDTDTGFSTGDRPSTSHAEKHSLYYIYTGLSKPLDLPGIYEFSAMGLLDDRQIDSYNSEEQRKIPKQQWMKEKMQEDYWEKGTQSRKSKEQWFNVNVNILMDRMRHNMSDLHILQWRTGCEVEIQGSEVKFSKGIDEYGYDGENFLSFDEAESQWVAPVKEALPTKRKWDNVPILNQYTKGYLEKECVDWLNKFREYADEELRNGSSPDVYKLTKKSTKDETKLKLTCLATGFYDKDVMLNIRRNCLPEDETESTGVRPNHDQTFQLRKSVEIKEDQIDEYDCHLTHRTLKNPIIVTQVNFTPPVVE